MIKWSADFNDLFSQHVDPMQIAHYKDARALNGHMFCLIYTQMYYESVTTNLWHIVEYLEPQGLLMTESQMH